MITHCISHHLPVKDVLSISNYFIRNAHRVNLSLVEKCLIEIISEDLILRILVTMCLFVGSLRVQLALIDTRNIVFMLNISPKSHVVS